MKEDCQTLVAELQSLLNTKQTLDAEIAIYRKMLEKEESRLVQLQNPWRIVFLPSESALTTSTK